MVFRVLFGDEAAERDPLLRECAVATHFVNAAKPVLTGRWGTGKTAILLLQNRELADTLKELDRDLRRAWYLDESTLDLTAILALQTRLLAVNGSESEQVAFLRAAEAIWRAEILRVFRRLLGLLWTHYAEPAGNHWDFVLSARGNRELDASLWSRVGTILPMLLHEPNAHGPGPEIETLFSDDAYRHIRACLRDIQGRTPVPAVAIEPIETPVTGIEAGGPNVAQWLVSALLNVYVRVFAPSDDDGDNPFVVRISIPWHRYDGARLDFPQKLGQYHGLIRWGKEDLASVVNRRIDWEYRRVGRPSSIDSWAELFPREIPNGICEPEVREDSFAYFVRHTHHRPRDILRLVRRCVEAEAEDCGLTTGEVLKDKKRRLRIPTIKETFRRVGLEATADLIAEAARRFPEVNQICERLHGMSQPFTLDELKKRLDGIDISIIRAADILWEAGIIGVTITPGDIEAARALTAAFTDDAHMQYRNRDGQQLDRWTWFEYNWEGDVPDLVARLSQPQWRATSWGVVFHPKTFEYFAPHTRDRTSPIGI